MVEQWIKDIVGGAPVRIGGRYLHPQDGLIEITSGEYWGNAGLSNFWHWTVIETGEHKHGYANWDGYPYTEIEETRTHEGELR